MIQEISAQEYEKALLASSYPVFQQSVYQGKRLADQGAKVVYVKNEHFYAMLIIRPLFKRFSYAYMARGMIGNLRSSEQVQFFMKELKTFLKPYRTVFALTDPMEELIERNENGEIVSGAKPHLAVIDAFTKAGWLHRELDRGYHLERECRWMSVLDLEEKSIDELFDAFDRKTRYAIKTFGLRGVQVRQLEWEELPILHDLMEQSGEKQSFAANSLHFIESFIKAYEGHARAYCAFLEVDDYLFFMNGRYQELMQEANKLDPNHKKQAKKRKGILLDAEQMKANIDQMSSLRGQSIPLAAGLFIFYGAEIVYLNSGSDPKWAKFNGSIILQWEMIQKAKQEGYRCYNFYGISGLFTPDSEGYGVFKFKQSFHARVIELIGDFYYPMNSFLFRLFVLKNKLRFEKSVIMKLRSEQDEKKADQKE